MNPKLAALQSLRSAPPSPELPSSDAPVPEAAPEGGPGDALIAKLTGLEGKVDQILKILGADQKNDAAEETDVQETPEQ